MWSSTTYPNLKSSVVTRSGWVNKRKTTSLPEDNGKIWFFTEGNMNDTALDTIGYEGSAAVIATCYRNRSISYLYYYYKTESKETTSGDPSG